MNTPEIFKFITKEDIEFNMNLYRAKDNRKDVTIIYFHGGGLLYGVRDDLPEIYLNKFLNAGYDFLALDYPLAPESKLDVMLKSSYEEILYYLRKHNEVFGLKNEKYILFGRSAGAYLCFMMCSMLINNDALAPAAIISLYGYTRVDEVEFNTPNKHYNKMAPVTDESVEKIISDKPVTYGPMDLRFSLYIKQRQEGTWINCISGNDDKSKYSLDDEVLKKFPPAILAAATLDPDVPYRISKRLSRLIPDSKLITVYEYVHDFDRDINSQSGRLTYENIINWLKDKI